MVRTKGSAAKAKVGSDTGDRVAGEGSPQDGRRYTVLARRYRSRDFGEIIGQDAIAGTLRSAIDSGRVAHAYLFCGTRGVGKTSMARIFACALNVTADLEEADAITQAILRGDDMDVIEIDGASNRGVQEARDLIAGAGLSPARCPYRIYIIDEVHMLTRDAFNTLLKTMEEPPPHVKFILCTTEPNKVPATIQSRCQRFDFRAIPTAVIARHLKDVCAREGIEADESVLRRVAAMGNGSMRDALSMLERLLAGGDRVISAAQAEELLGLPDHDVVVRLLDAIAAEQPGDALRVAQELFDRGATVELALEMMLEQYRALLLLLACGEAGMSDDIGEAERAAAQNHAPHFDLAGVVHAMALCDAGSRNARNSASARALFDATIVRLCLARHVADIAGLLANDSEKKKGGGDGSGARRAVESARSARPVATAVAANAPAVRAAPAAPAAAGPSGKRSGERASVSGESAGSGAGKAAAAGVTQQKSGATGASSESGSGWTAAPEVKGIEPLTADALWSRVIDAVEGSPRDHACVSGFAVRQFDGQTLKLEVADGTRAGGFRANEAAVISRIVSNVIGQSVSVEIVDDPDQMTESDGQSGAAQIDELSRSMPAVRKAAEIFQAVVIKVEKVPKARSEDGHV